MKEYRCAGFRIGCFGKAGTGLQSGREVDAASLAVPMRSGADKYGRRHSFAATATASNELGFLCG